MLDGILDWNKVAIIFDFVAVVFPAFLVFLVTRSKNETDALIASQSTRYVELEGMVKILSDRVDVLSERNKKLYEDFVLSEEYIYILKDHIYNELPPPPPCRPKTVYSKGIE